MKFEEKREDIMTFPKCKSCFIYFLLQDDEVVYVGQTSTGLSRPFSHYDKVFDTVKVLPCDPYVLDETEDFYINKYSPKYNKTRNPNVIYSLQRTKRVIKADYNLPKYNLWELRKDLSALNITPTTDGFEGYECITVEQFYKVHSFVGRRCGHE